MHTPELILKKRNGSALSKAEIDYLIKGFTSHAIPDYQMSALLMAIYFRGMTAAECVDLTMSMARSGEMADLGSIKGFKVDKHSTGGVGDTTSLVLAPLVAAAGGTVAKMTGRELGHTGGTVDKLESIPGMNLELTKDQFIRIANEVGLSLAAQSDSLAPADKQIYALRNVTGTVDSIPLIAASIMSKKLAGGADGIVLDVKTGSGAFMRKYQDSVELAQTMVRIGDGAGRKMLALITSMEQPLGEAVGNALEVKEAIETLQGRGPQDLVELVLELGANMLMLCGLAGGLEEAKERLAQCIEDGSGADKMAKFIKAQGGDPRVVKDTGLLPRANTRIEVTAPLDGYVQRIDALDVGMASKLLGAGRTTKDEVLDLSIGLILKKKVGSQVMAGEPLAELHTDGNAAKVDLAKTRLLQAYTIGSRPVPRPRLILARVTADNIEEISYEE